VEGHVGPEVAVGDPEAANDLDPVDLFRDSDVNGEGGDFFGHCIRENVLFACVRSIRVGRAAEFL